DHRHGRREERRPRGARGPPSRPPAHQPGNGRGRRPPLHRRPDHHRRRGVSALGGARGSRCAARAGPGAPEAPRDDPKSGRRRQPGGRPGRGDPPGPHPPHRLHHRRRRVDSDTQSETKRGGGSVPRRDRTALRLRSPPLTICIAWCTTYSTSTIVHSRDDTRWVMTEEVIRVRGLRMRYGDVDVLTGVDFGVRRGEVVALLRPNGAGKTTTIEILEGFRKRSDGEVIVLGADPENADDDWRARVGVVLQSWRDHARWTPRALLSHLGTYYAPYSTPDRPRPYDVDELLAMVRLQDQADQKIRTLSGGQRRRLDVAVGIVGRPELLFLDEPTAGFDPEARREFHELIHRLTDMEDTTVLLTTHDLDEADKVADRILILVTGRIVDDGSADVQGGKVDRDGQVKWTIDGQHFVHPTSDATAFVRELLSSNPNVEDLEIRRATLEDTYIALVRSVESGHGVAPIDAFAEAG